MRYDADIGSMVPLRCGIKQRGGKYLIVLWIILAILVLIFLLPYGVDVGYLDQVFFLKVKAGPLRIKILPKKEKTPEQLEEEKKKKEAKAAEKKAKEAKKAEEKKAKEADKPPKKKKSFLPKAGLSDWMELAQKAFQALGKIFGSFHADYLCLHCVVGTPDPYDTATRFGYISAAVEALLNEKQGLLKVRKQDVSLDMDFLSESMFVEGELVISAALWRLVGAVLVLGVQFLRWRRVLLKKEKKEHIAEPERTEENGRE